jgi:hypothetical protein
LETFSIERKVRIRNMRSTPPIRLLLATLILLLPASFAFNNGKEKDKNSKDAVLTLIGDIEDSQCAFNVHSATRSHEAMIKQGVPGATDEKSCTMHCVKDMGGNFVLVVKNDVYRLDDQGYAERFAGVKVKLTGTLDSRTHTLHVLSIEDAK